MPIFRKKYAAPSKQADAKRHDDSVTARMTAAELDAFVAEQMQTMLAGLNLDGPREPVGKAGLFRRA